MWVVNTCIHKKTHFSPSAYLYLSILQDPATQTLVTMEAPVKSVKRSGATHSLDTSASAHRALTESTANTVSSYSDLFPSYLFTALFPLKFPCGENQVFNFVYMSMWCF